MVSRSIGPNQSQEKRAIIEHDAGCETYKCLICGASWRYNEDGSWSLWSKFCGECCDNAPMGDQIAPLGAK